MAAHFHSVDRSVDIRWQHKDKERDDADPSDIGESSNQQADCEEKFKRAAYVNDGFAHGYRGRQHVHHCLSPYEVSNAGKDEDEGKTDPPTGPSVQMYRYRPAVKACENQVGTEQNAQNDNKVEHQNEALSLGLGQGVIDVRGRQDFRHTMLCGLKARETSLQLFRNAPKSTH